MRWLTTMPFTRVRTSIRSRCQRNGLAHIEAWFGAVLHRTLRIPDLSDRGLTFVGGRLLVVDGVPVTQLLYRWPGRPHEPFGLCISPDPSSERGLTTDAREGLQQVLWRRKGYTYVLVGWTSRASWPRLRPN